MSVPSSLLSAATTNTCETALYYITGLGRQLKQSWQQAPQEKRQTGLSRSAQLPSQLRGRISCPPQAAERKRAHRACTHSILTLSHSLHTPARAHAQAHRLLGTAKTSEPSVAIAAPNAICHGLQRCHALGACQSVKTLTLKTLSPARDPLSSPPPPL